MKIKNKEIEKQFGALFFTERRYFTHPLLEPIEGYDSITVRPLSHTRNLELGKDADDFDLLSEMTGIDTETLELLKTPDWNVLVDFASKLNTKSSYELGGFKYDPSKRRVAILFTEQPFWVDFQMPTVGLTRKLKHITDPNKKLRTFLENLTDLSSKQIDEMPTPDLTMLDYVVADFLKQKAAFFQ